LRESTPLSVGAPIPLQPGSIIRLGAIELEVQLLDKVRLERSQQFCAAVAANDVEKAMAMLQTSPGVVNEYTAGQREKIAGVAALAPSCCAR